jgi:hypothetical protein
MKGPLTLALSPAGGEGIFCSLPSGSGKGMA